MRRFCSGPDGCSSSHGGADNGSGSSIERTYQRHEIAADRTDGVIRPKWAGLAMASHIHADHLSRSRQLAQVSGATLFLPAQQRVSFPFTAIRDGNTLDTGSVHLTALHRPGHTIESTCYLLNNQVLFTGDTLFPTGIGRPDLEADEGEARQRASALYHSLRKLFALPSETLVLPGHTSTPVPFDGEPIVTTLAEIDEQVGIIHATHDRFVQMILTRLPATPPNYERIVRYNETGILPQSDVTELEAGANRCAIS